MGHFGGFSISIRLNFSHNLSYGKKKVLLVPINIQVEIKMRHTHTHTPPLRYESIAMIPERQVKFGMCMRIMGVEAVGGGGAC